MTIPGNTWIEAWNSATAVPARRQKRLFDDTKEAENVFNWLNSLNIGQIVEQILPIVFYSAIHTSYSAAVKYDLKEYLASTFDVLVERVISNSRNDNDPNKYQDLVGYVKAIEQIVSLMKSIYSKFTSSEGSPVKDDV